MTDQLNWAATQTRPDILHVCELNMTMNKSKIEDIVCANKTTKNSIRKLSCEISLYGLKSNIHQML